MNFSQKKKIKKTKKKSALMMDTNAMGTIKLHFERCYELGLAA
jgi:hypothetical protein